ncbi:hypothetical protein DKM44_13810 [Deinococcus irradiatisoli]|uniref:Uncharacterized protein n=1 Tax=Deinococcus irradiatisoli TaxID=2202254 RepID=A0A2Z3JGQ0_9DEIO|nr:hypothetical protein [Deinococcus irradiatisoli]AWN24172.1 hypothetical protein DKM44_13810 [Deinococcus irradiatisoli]
MKIQPFTILLLCSALLLGAASAQQTQPGQGQNGQQRQLDPAQRARFQAMQPIFDLSSRVSLLPELEKNKATAVTKAQAKQLLPLLQKLQTSASITGPDATKMLSQIEDKILSDKQVTALDDLDLKRQEERRAARQKAGASGNRQGGAGFRIPGLPGGGFGGRQGQRPAGQGQQAGQGQGGPGSGPFNPFKMGRGADALKAYIAVLQKK